MTNGMADTHSSRRSALLDGLTYAALTILVWGVNAPRRGMWQDDVQAMGEAFRRAVAPHPLQRLFAPDHSPLRRLKILPVAIAYATPQPIWTLHLICAAMWLAVALAAGWVVGLLLPGRRWTRFAVVCLTLTATSDFTTGSMVAVGYNLAVLLLLAAAGCALLWLDRGRTAALIASAILLACSLLTIDVAFPAIPFLALLFVWLGRAHARRLAALLAAWGMVVVPTAVVEWSFLHDPKSYAAMAMVPQSKGALLRLAVTLWTENFTPWRWAFARPEWYVRPPMVIPWGWMAAGSLLAAALFLLRARTKVDDAAPDDHRSLGLAVFFAAAALAANAAYAMVWFSEFHYRTHILSRVWASAAIGIVAGWVVTRGSPPRAAAPQVAVPRAAAWAVVPRAAAWVVVTAFVFFGAWGGFERQDYFLAMWQQQQRELASIVDAAPSLRHGTAVILRSSSTSGRFLATEADYLTAHWLRLLYGEPKLRTLRLNPERGASCRPSSTGLDCLSETGSHDLSRFEELVVMDYDPRAGTYHLVRTLGDARYRPEKRIVARPWSVRQQRLLLMNSN
jgi:hypothetical protein